MSQKTFPFKGMIFEGGGTAGAAHLGAVQIFKEQGILPHIHYFVGSSAGAIMATALAVNCDLELLKTILLSTDFGRFTDDSCGLIRDIIRLIKNYGWYQGDQLEKWYGEVLTQLGCDPNITFKQVYEKYGNYLCITVTNINLGITEYLNHEIVPDMTVKKAVRRSGLMPFIFKADREKRPTNFYEHGQLVTREKTHYLVDGGLLNNYPIQQLDHLLKKEEVVGCKLINTAELAEINNPRHENYHSSKNIIQYLTSFYSIVRSQALKCHVDEEDWQRTIKINVLNYGSTDFDMTDDQKTTLIKQGRQAALAFLKIDE